MNGSDGVVHLSGAQGPEQAVEAAVIWARARARRDNTPPPPTVETMHGIERRLGLERAKLVLAWRDGRPVGFTLFAPGSGTLEVFYLAVDPEAWGTGVASHLLLSAEEHAREMGRDMLELWVIDDNKRAIGVYEKAGWVGTQELKRDTPEGPLERRFLRHSG